MALKMNQNQVFPNCDQLAECFSKSFKHLNVEQMNLLFLEEECTLLKRGSVIYSEGDSARGCYFVYSGILKIFKTGLEGKEQIIRFAKSGEIIGFRSALSQEPACTSSKVIEEAVVYFIPNYTITQLIEKNPAFSIELIKMTCRELGDANSYITDIAQKSVRERLAEVLMHLMETFGLAEDDTLQISLTREELANMVGTATESVIRLLSEFKNDGLIEIKGRKIKIVDVRSLKRVGGVY